MPINLEDIVVRNDAVLGADVNGETVLLDVESGLYFGMAETARTIWDAVAAPTVVATLCGQLAEQFEAPAEVIEADTLAFLDRLEARGLVRRAPR